MKKYLLGLSSVMCTAIVVSGLMAVYTAQATPAEKWVLTATVLVIPAYLVGMIGSLS